MEYRKYPNLRSTTSIKSQTVYQAIEAISRAGVIHPLETVEFDENEHVVILRLSETYVGAIPLLKPSADWWRWAGILKNSPNLNEDPVGI